MRPVFLTRKATTTLIVNRLKRRRKIFSTSSLIARDRKALDDC